jgi:hypothetical protein
MRRIPIIGVFLGAILFVLDWVGYLQIAADAVRNQGVIVAIAVAILTSTWFSLGLFFSGIIALALIQFGVPSWLKKKEPITIVLSPRWSIPVFATVINNERDYATHVQRSTLYGLTKRLGERQTLHDASKFKTSVKDCRKPPYTIEPERKMEQAYGGFIPFENFKFLQAEIELENGRIFASKKVKSPTPPRDKQKPIQNVPQEAEPVEEAENISSDAYHTSSRRFNMVVGVDHTSDNIWPGRFPVRFHHAQVSIDSGTVHGCRAYLTRIKGETTEWKGNEQLTFSPSEASDSLSKAVYAKVPYQLDVLVVTSGGEIIVCNHNREWLRLPRLRDLFATHGFYDLSIAIAGEDASAETFLVRFQWTGNWQDSFLTEAKPASQPRRAASNSSAAVNKVTDDSKLPSSSTPLRPIEIRDLLDSSIKKGRSLMEQWKTNFGDYQREQQRENESAHWLSETSAVVKEHLTIKQFDEFMIKRQTAMDIGKRFTVSLEILSAGVKQESDGFKLAFEVASKLEILERFRSEVTRLS